MKPAGSAACFLLAAVWYMIGRLFLWDDKNDIGVQGVLVTAITIAGIEIAHMIRKGQLRSTEKLCPAQQFHSLAG
jgi:hypothetical protein